MKNQFVSTKLVNWKRRAQPEISHQGGEAVHQNQNWPPFGGADNDKLTANHSSPPLTAWALWVAGNCG